MIDVTVFRPYSARAFGVALSAVDRVFSTSGDAPKTWIKGTELHSIGLFPVGLYASSWP